MNTRNSILRGQKPNASHLNALQSADSTLRMVRNLTRNFTTCRLHLNIKLRVTCSDVGRDGCTNATRIGTPRDHRRPRRTHIARPGCFPGEVARRRPIPGANSADPHESIDASSPTSILLRSQASTTSHSALSASLRHRHFPKRYPRQALTRHRFLPPRRYLFSYSYGVLPSSFSLKPWT